MDIKLRIARIALASALPWLTAAPAFAAAKPPSDIARATYTAKLVDASVVVPYLTSLPVTVKLNRLTSVTEALQLDRLLAERGASALHDALSEQTLGQIEIDGGIGDPIRFARRFRDRDGEHLVLVAQRPTSAESTSGAWPAQRYPYLIVTLDLTAEGLGSGELIAAARFRTRKDGRVELDNPGFLASRLLAVRELGS